MPSALKVRRLPMWVLNVFLPGALCAVAPLPASASPQGCFFAVDLIYPDCLKTSPGFYMRCMQDNLGIAGYSYGRDYGIVHNRISCLADCGSAKEIAERECLMMTSSDLNKCYRKTMKSFSHSLEEAEKLGLKRDQFREGFSFEIIQGAEGAMISCPR